MSAMSVLWFVVFLIQRRKNGDTLAMLLVELLTDSAFMTQVNLSCEEKCKFESISSCEENVNVRFIFLRSAKCMVIMVLHCANM